MDNIEQITLNLLRIPSHPRIKGVQPFRIGAELIVVSIIIVRFYVTGHGGMKRNIVLNKDNIVVSRLAFTFYRSVRLSIDRSDDNIVRCLIRFIGPDIPGSRIQLR